MLRQDSKSEEIGMEQLVVFLYVHHWSIVFLAALLPSSKGGN